MPRHAKPAPHTSTSHKKKNIYIYPQRKQHTIYLSTSLVLKKSLKTRRVPQRHHTTDITAVSPSLFSPQASAVHPPPAPRRYRWRQPPPCSPRRRHLRHGQNYVGCFYLAAPPTAAAAKTETTINTRVRKSSRTRTNKNHRVVISVTIYTREPARRLSPMDSSRDS